MRLEGKVAVVTGAAAGIGAATAALFIKEGARVVLADSNLEQAEKVARALGANALAVGVDVTVAAQIKHLIAATLAEFGGLDILVNNAGYGIRGSVVNTDEEDWDKVIDVNLKSVFLCSKYAIPEIEKRGGGAVVNISSTAAVCGIPDRAAYVAAKGGVASLTRSMALDHADKNIRINSIAPGVIWSNYYEKMLKEVPDPDAFVHGLKARAPVNRMGTPQEIATMVLFLACEESSFATGGMFTVDGGYTAR
ncbi:MAG: short chain dehydrogenase family protein [Caballeronia sp.]|jgi:NAD(P)-dependent dehydrogenase (short-subunit alcohol dehydrogenase family)|uniref:SDR family oxidoreductase n=1 Tax=Caballeronia sp. TaxID=1931223 RepID=UPI00262ADDF1|nr:SDR family oxidoreductase [Caballeronia sp.]MDB5837958.1 short chain dehydrogenase family protein [Caballeronia sp.]